MYVIIYNSILNYIVYFNNLCIYIHTQYFIIHCNFIRLYIVSLYPLCISTHRYHIYILHLYLIRIGILGTELYSEAYSHALIVPQL